MSKQKKDTPAQVSKASTKVTKVTTKTQAEKPEVKEEWPLRKGDSFLFIKNGKNVYYPRSTANVLFQRNTAEIEIPKGSEYVPPKGSQCKGCGNG
jgi:hypothetical protein